MNKKKGFLHHIKRDYILYLFLLPALVYYIMFRYGPMFGVVIAFKDYNIFQGIFASKWVGLDVFGRIFREEFFWLSVTNTIILNLLVLAVTFPTSIIIALMLNEVNSKLFKRTSQSILYLPYFVSWVTIAGIVVNMFSVNNGSINNLLMKMGQNPVPFLIENGWWIFVYVLANVWKDVGWGTIIYLAALAAVDETLYEAAYIDGATKLQRIWHITLPCIRSTMIIMLILSISRMMFIGLDAPILLQNNKVIDVSEVLSTYVYKMGLQRVQYSFATAVGLFQSVINIILLTMADRFAKAINQEGIF